MKKLVAVVLVALLLLIAGCTKKEEAKVYVIGINQLIEHGSLDEVREGFKEELKTLGMEVKILEQNAQGEVSTASTIANNFIDEKVDLILAIATPAAQATANVTSDIPVLFSAVTDPVAADLVDSIEKPGRNVTGTSDAQNVEAQLALFHKINPEIKTVGILYNTGEMNSQIQVEQSVEAAKKLDLTIESIGVNAIGEVPQALDQLLPKIDAMYIITDNMVANSMQLVSDRLIDEKMISVAAFEAAVDEGALITSGLSYRELGKQTARMAKAILVDNKKPEEVPVEHSEVENIKYNKKVLLELGLSEDLEVLKGAQVVE